MRESARAAIQTVKVAELSLQSDRPYLLIDKAELIGFYPSDPYPRQMRDSDYLPLQVGLYLTNYGKGPVVLHEILLQLKMIQAGEYPAARDYSDCRPLRVKGPSDWRAAYVRKIIKPDGPFEMLTDEAEGPSGQKSRQTISTNSQTLIAYGVVRYRDVFERPYETGFCWVYDPVGGFMYAYPEANNYST